MNTNSSHTNHLNSTGTQHLPGLCCPTLAWATFGGRLKKVCKRQDASECPVKSVRKLCNVLALGHADYVDVRSLRHCLRWPGGGHYNSSLQKRNGTLEKCVKEAQDHQHLLPSTKGKRSSELEHHH